MLELCASHRNKRCESYSDDISSRRAMDATLLSLSRQMDHIPFHTSIASNDNTNESVQMHYADHTVMIDN